ncbi:hypothetical protein NMY22_g5997 [Coprinellus aureogranulatus]|nr:hypothetical protein NMY22_g5997 [Coprinellus aureogranulatus]
MQFQADAHIGQPDAPVIAQALQSLTEPSRACIERLLKHFSETKDKHYSLSSEPEGKLAAVLVLLYEKDGELRVLLTTRSKKLRTHAGQTALPGGRVDREDGDRTFADTALREAREEVGLPKDSPHIHILGRLNPFISLHRLVVIPVVALLTQPDLLNDLKASEDEVADIFSHPLEAILDPTISAKEPLSAIGSENWPYEASDHYNTSDSAVEVLGNTSYRMHRFRTSGSPIKGLTADILIRVAEIAYNKPTVYDRWAPGQITDFAEVMKAIDKNIREAQANGKAERGRP